MPINAPSEPQLRQHLAALKRRLAELKSQQEDESEALKRGIQGLIDEVRVSIAWVEYILNDPGEEYIAHRHLLPRF
jgi:ribosomal protein L29